MRGLELIGALVVIGMGLAVVWVIICLIDGYIRGEVGARRNEVRFPRRFGQD